MADLQPPPTYALPILVDPVTQEAQFNPIWLNWFLQLTLALNDAGGLSIGDVIGPSSATDEAFARFDGTSGKLIQNSVTTQTDTGLVTTITYTDASSSEGPRLHLYRDSLSPALSDQLGSLRFDGENSVGNTITYGKIRTVIRGFTGSAEDGEIQFSTKQASLSGGEATLSFRKGLIAWDASLGVLTDQGQGTANFSALAIRLNSAMDASAIFQADSTTKGMLIPRMTTTQRDAISSPATSLLIFNTTTGAYNYYTGATWSAFGGSGDVVGPGSATDNAAVRFDSTTGKLVQNSAFSIDDSGNVSSFGGQITFPATQSPSSNANTLDDYEEGTFTPTITSSGGGAPTYNTQGGFYTKIGDRIFFTLRIVLTNLGTLAAGTITFTGLPFTSDSTTNNVTSPFISANNLNASVTTALATVIVNNASQVVPVKYAAGAQTQLTVADLNTNASITISGHYK